MAADDQGSNDPKKKQSNGDSAKEPARRDVLKSGVVVGGAPRQQRGLRGVLGVVNVPCAGLFGEGIGARGGKATPETCFGKLATEFGVTPRAIRFCDDVGLQLFVSCDSVTA